jgi:hypothetical protein
MTRSALELVALAAGASALCFLVAAPARADDLAECLAAHEQAQRLRRDGKLSQTRTRLEVCVREACPGPVREDCTSWLDGLAAAQPSLVVVAREPGSAAEVADVRVIVDGAQIAARLTGQAFPVDPGERRVRVQAADGRVVEQTVLVSEGEKGRRVELTLPPRPPPPAKEPPPATSPPASVFVLGAIGVAGVAGFGVLAGLGLARENELADTCSPRCSSDRIAGARRFYIAADISGAVGLVSGAAAITIALVRPGAKTTHAALRVAPTALALEGRW